MYDLQRVRDLLDERMRLFESGSVDQDRHRQISTLLVSSIPFLMGQIEIYERLTGHAWRPIRTWHRPDREDFIMVCGNMADDSEGESPMVMEARWDGEKFHALAFDGEVLPTHWMPLPEKPR